MDKSVDTLEQNKHYRRSSVILKSIFLAIASTPSPPFQCCNTLRGHFDLVTTLKRGEGVEMSKLDIEKLSRSERNRSFSGGVSTTFVHDSSLKCQGREITDILG